MVCACSRLLRNIFWFRSVHYFEIKVGSSSYDGSFGADLAHVAVIRWYNFHVGGSPIVAKL